jgi:prepilin-type N-terminal cleavage/methylation domain-containing protein
MRRTTHVRRGFSLIEMLIALAITGTLLAATLGALDASFKAYKFTTDSASTHVVSRIVMHRLMAMIRTGQEFAPAPIDTLDPDQNPIESTFLEFNAFQNDESGELRTVRIERRDAVDAAQGPYELWAIQTEFLSGLEVRREERPLIVGVQEVRFTLEYEAGPRLARATVDLTIRPNDMPEATVHTSIDAPTIRLVSSISPRRIDLE